MVFASTDEKSGLIQCYQPPKVLCDINEIFTYNLSSPRKLQTGGETVQSKSYYEKKELNVERSSYS